VIGIAAAGDHAAVVFDGQSDYCGKPNINIDKAVAEEEY
jgi:hypothetical protein